MTDFTKKGAVIPYKIVVDSSADMKELEGADFASAPLKIITKQKEYTDNGALDVEGMVKDLAAYSGCSSSSCPSVGDWLEVFGEAENIFCLTITATLSGSYNAACMARDEYLELHPERRVLVLNTLTAGPEIAVIAEYIRDLLENGEDFDSVCSRAEEYSRHTALLFMLESMKNLANNGRVKPIVAKAAGLLGIRVVGKASAKGDLEPLGKFRGEARALGAIVRSMVDMHCVGGRVKIAHCFNESAAEKLKGMIESAIPSARVEVYPTGGLCSFYAENGGLLIGFETIE